MRATRADLLFALPRPVERAMLLGDVQAWAQPLRSAGIAVVEHDPCDLVVAAASELRTAARSEAPMLLLDGHVSRRRLRDVGLVGERFLPVPSLDHPSLVVPLDRPRGAHYALTTLSAPSERIKRLRNHALAAAVRLGVKPPGTVTLASRDAAPPLLVKDASALDIPRELEWVLALGRSTERGVFHLFDAGQARPGWVLKFSRAQLEEVEAPTDATGLAAAASVDGAVGSHAPRLLGVGESAGRPFVVETAAIGAPLVNILRAPLRPAQKTGIIDAVAAWLIDVGAASIAENTNVEAVSGLDAAARLAPDFGADFTSLTAPLAALPVVLEHGDVGLEHVIVDGDSFVVIDWERAQRRGLALADLAFFLAQALPVLDGEVDDPRYGRDVAFARLFRGESPAAPTLRRWLARACDAWALEPELLAPLLSIVWLRLAQVDVRRHFAAVWFGDPALGPSWSAWRR